MNLTLSGACDVEEDAQEGDEPYLVWSFRSKPGYCDVEADTQEGDEPVVICTNIKQNEKDKSQNTHCNKHPARIA